MCGDERSFRMARNYPVALIKQLFFRELSPMKAPVRMCRQLLEALIAAIDRQEKGVGISDVEHDRDPQLSRFIENGRKALIVYLQQRSGAIAHAQSKVFPELDSFGSVLHEPFQPIEGQLDKVVLFDS